MSAPRRCVLLFSRSPRAETRSKRLAGAEPLFAAAAEQVARAAGDAGFDLLLLPQRGRGFAERLGNAFADARAEGYDQIVVVPGDVPGLDAALLAETALALDEGRAVLGPCPDGGVYLLGLVGEGWARALEDVRWRTTHVFEDLLFRTRASGPRVLRPLADVDRRRDLDRVVRENGLDRELTRLILALGRRPSLPPPSPLGPPPCWVGRGVELLRGPPSLSS